MFVGLTNSEVDRLIAASYDPDPEIRRCVRLRLGAQSTGILSGLAAAAEREEIVRRVRTLLDEIERIRMGVACD